MSSARGSASYSSVWSSKVTPIGMHRYSFENPESSKEWTDLVLRPWGARDVLRRCDREDRSSSRLRHREELSLVLERGYHFSVFNLNSFHRMSRTAWQRNITGCIHLKLETGTYSIQDHGSGDFHVCIFLQKTPPTRYSIFH